MHRPTPISPDALIAAVSPCGPSAAPELAAGLEWLRAQGHPVRCEPEPGARHGFLAGTDEARFASLRAALLEPAVAALWVTRGGYGATRLLERYGDELLRLLRAHPKPLLGLSDVTALHALWSRAGLSSWHAPMLGSIGRSAVDARDRDAALAALRGAVPEPWRLPEALVPGGARGRCVGGNVSVFAALAGTPWLPQTEGAVLLLEDVGERPYRLDRMLTTLRMAGFFTGVRAVVLGEFVACDAGPDGVSARAVLHERLGSLSVPLWCGAPFGHGARQSPFAPGAELRLESDGTLVFC